MSDEHYEIDKGTADNYLFLTHFASVQVVCSRHASLFNDNHAYTAQGLWDVLVWVEEHEREHHGASAAPADQVDPDCPGGPWCRCRTQHGRLKSPPCPQQGPNPHRYPKPT